LNAAVAGLIGYVVVVAVLVSSTPLPWLDALFLAALLELLPVFAIAQVDLARDLTVVRTQAYATSAVTILLLGIISLILGSRLVGTEGIGLAIEAGRVAHLSGWAVGTFAIGMATLWLFRVVRKSRGWVESRLVHELMPVTRREKGLFAALSLCAGLGEELAYRGYAISAVLVAGGSAALALALTSVAFAVLHSYQGALGIVRTGVVGLIMGAVFLYTGSVWPAVSAHVLIDLAVGFVFADKLLS
jgi:membrane protease YdiL (CAAX protease family)